MFCDGLHSRFHYTAVAQTSGAALRAFAKNKEAAGNEGREERGYARGTRGKNARKV